MTNFITPIVTKTIVAAGISGLWDYFSGGSIGVAVLAPVFGGGFAVSEMTYNAMLQGAVAFFGGFIDSTVTAAIPNNIKGIVLERAIVSPLGGAVVTGGLSYLTMAMPNNPIVNRSSPPANYMQVAAEAGRSWTTQFIGNNLSTVVHTAVTGRAHRLV